MSRSPSHAAAWSTTGSIPASWELMPKNKGGREIRKPKQPKKPKVVKADPTALKINGAVKQQAK